MVGFRGQEITKGNWGYCWCRRCYNPTIVQINVPACESALPRRLQIRYTDRSIAADVKLEKSPFFLYLIIILYFKGVIVFCHK